MHWHRTTKAAKLFVIVQFNCFDLTDDFFYGSVRKEVNGKHMFWVVLAMSTFKVPLKCFAGQSLAHSRYGSKQGPMCYSPTPHVRACWPLWEATTNTNTTATGQRPNAPTCRPHVYSFTPTWQWRLLCSRCVVGTAWHCVVWTAPPVSLPVLLCSRCWDSWLSKWTYQSMTSLLLVSYFCFHHVHLLFDSFHCLFYKWLNWNISAVFIFYALLV